MNWIITAHRVTEPGTADLDLVDRDGRIWMVECLTPGCLWYATGPDPAQLDYRAAHHVAGCAPDPFEAGR